MLDLKHIRTEPDEIRKALKRRHSDAPLDELLKIDGEWRAKKQETDELRSERNRLSVDVAKAKKKGEDPKELISKMRSQSKKLDEMEKKVKIFEKNIESLLLEFPNIPLDSVPGGKDEEDNVNVRSWGEKRDKKVLSHWELGKKTDTLDFERGAKLAGTRFTVLKTWASRLERALINLMLDTHSNNGYSEITPPFMVNKKTMTGTGQLPKFEEDLYVCERDSLYLIPTAEVPLVNMHADEILLEDDLPLNYVSYTPCFRREAGAYGKDIKGIMRQHQFDKVELVKITEPENSESELETIVSDAESILKLLEIPYRVNELCTGELGFASAKTYDIESWIPSQGKYREISSCSNCGDFQARRSNIRYRKKGKLHYPHTLNGSGIAVGRALIAVTENHQEDGVIKLPKALQKYFGQKEIKA